MSANTGEDQPLREPIVSVRGEKVGLGPIRREDVPLFVAWFNDFEVTRNLQMLSSTGRATLEAEEEWYESYVRKSKGDSDATFGIYELASGRLIGNCSLASIDPVHRTASFGIVIGSQEHRNRGLGTEATRLILDYGFNVLGLHSIMLTVYAYNARAIRAYEKAGFKLSGRQRESRRLAGEVYDTLLMDVLATEFESPVLKRELGVGSQPKATV